MSLISTPLSMTGFCWFLLCHLLHVVFWLVLVLQFALLLLQFFVLFGWKGRVFGSGLCCLFLVILSFWMVFIKLAAVSVVCSFRSCSLALSCCCWIIVSLPWFFWSSGSFSICFWSIFFADFSAVEVFMDFLWWSWVCCFQDLFFVSILVDFLLTSVISLWVLGGK